MRREGNGGDPKGWFTPHVRYPEKYPDCRTDLIGEGGTQTFAPGGKHLRAATDLPSLSIAKCDPQAWARGGLTIKHVATPTLKWPRIRR